MASKGIGHDLDREMRFAGAIMAVMSGMVMAIIDNGEVLRRESRRQQGVNFGRDRPHGMVVHGPQLA